MITFVQDLFLNNVCDIVCFNKEGKEIDTGSFSELKFKMKNMIMLTFQVKCLTCLFFVKFLI